jgi:NAD(P)H-dependent flavin oxidoreductase YrpB (nitropropane dioxygenase family)
MATEEAPIHHSIKEELVRATERDTALIMRTFRNTSRIFKVIFNGVGANMAEFSCGESDRN